MINSLNDKKGFIHEFDYQPEQAESFYKFTIDNIDSFYSSQGFAKRIDIQQFVDMFMKCTSAQMDELRGAFHAVYRPENIKNVLAEDLSSIEELINGISIAKESATLDKIQLLQYRWFLDALLDIKRKLSK